MIWLQIHANSHSRPKPSNIIKYKLSEDFRPTFVACQSHNMFPTRAGSFSSWRDSEQPCDNKTINSKNKLRKQGVRWGYNHNRCNHHRSNCHLLYLGPLQHDEGPVQRCLACNDLQRRAVECGKHRQCSFETRNLSLRYQLPSLHQECNQDWKQGLWREITMGHVEYLLGLLLPVRVERPVLHSSLRISIIFLTLDYAWLILDRSLPTARWCVINIYKLLHYSSSNQADSFQYPLWSQSPTSLQDLRP